MTIHRCPPDGSGIMPCCGRTPFEVPVRDRMTLEAVSVTCAGPENPPRATPEEQRAIDLLELGRAYSSRRQR